MISKQHDEGFWEGRRDQELNRIASITLAYRGGRGVRGGGCPKGNCSPEGLPLWDSITWKEIDGKGGGSGTYYGHGCPSGDNNEDGEDA